MLLQIHFGPKVVSEIDITRHLIKYAPQYLEEDARPVSAIAPGVLGTTGIETMEVIKGIVENIKPKLIIVIDSLASKSIERISSTVQLSDTGIVPGAGVGNKRNEISINTLRNSSNCNWCANGGRSSNNCIR